jgi:hypothetical protein
MNDDRQEIALAGPQVPVEFAHRIKIVTCTLAMVKAEFMLPELLPFPKRGIME